MTRQTLMRDTFAGPKPVQAPGGWVFNDTDTIVWCKLLEQTRLKDFKRQRDKFMVEAKIEVLANVLACSLGMALTYWVMQARELVKEERNDS